MAIGAHRDLDLDGGAPQTVGRAILSRVRSRLGVLATRSWSSGDSPLRGGWPGVFATAILWLDTLLLGALRSPAEAGVYAAATRYLAVGQFIGVAISQVVGPKLSELLASSERDRSRLRQVFATSTAWLMLLSWPLYLTMIVMAPSLLAVFGERYPVAERVLMILGGAMLVATAVGPVDIVLLMSGKSLWNLLNTTVAVASNVVLNLLLIPHLGITGAAIAWAVSILLNNLLPLLQVWRVARRAPLRERLGDRARRAPA